MKDLKIRNPKEFDNIKQIIYNSAAEYGDKTAFVIKTKEKEKINYNNISYKKLLEDINALGTALYGLGYSGKRIAVIGKNRYEWVLAHLANVMGGIVSIPLDKDLQLEELESSLVRSKAEAIIYDDKLNELVREIEQRGNTEIKDYICMSKDIDNLLKNGYEAIKKRRHKLCKL